MSLMRLFLRDVPAKILTSPDTSITFDALFNEIHTRTAQATQLPVENGASISDHIITDLPMLNIEGTISATPAKSSIAGIGAGLLGAIAARGFDAETSGIIATIGAVAASALAAQVSPSIVLDTWNKLNDVMDRKQTVTMVTGLKVYNSMVIENLENNRDFLTGNELRFTMTLRQIVIALTQLAVIPNDLLGGDTVTNLQAQAAANVGDTTSGQSFDNLNSEVNTALQNGRTAGINAAGQLP